MLTGGSAESAAAFIASYHRPPAIPLPRTRRRRQPVIAEPYCPAWTWFRISVLNACLIWPQSTSALVKRFDIVHYDGSNPKSKVTSAGRAVYRSLARLTRRGLLVRTDDGYRTTERGRCALADLRALGLDNAERDS